MTVSPDDLWAMLSGNRGWHEVWLDHEVTWIPAPDRKWFVRAVAGHSLAGRCLVSACPRLGKEQFALQSNVLWARVEGTASANALAAFRPAPTVVLRDGQTTRRVALWALERPLRPDWAEKAAKRLAHRFGGRTVKDTDPDTFLFEPPGLKVGVESFGGGLYRAREVVEQLRDAPDSQAWRRERQAA